MTLYWWQQPVKAIDADAQQAAQQRQGQLTKPPGSLGQLESLAIQLAGLQANATPVIEQCWVAVFAADHGIAHQGVSAFPQIVTTEMVRNFARGGAAISVMATEQNAHLEVVNVGTAHDPGELPGVVDQRIGEGTADFSQQPAMTPEQGQQALAAGRDSVQRALDAGSQLYIGGEMGIANTTSAAALGCVLLNQPAQQLVGPGTGLDDAGVRHKAEVIDTAITRHAIDPQDAQTVLHCFGGFEIAALTGAYVHAAQQGLPVLIDGFICSVAALIAEKLLPGSRQWFIYSHRSAEPGHRAILDDLQAEPLLDLGMRLGEGSGAAVALSLLRHACALHNGMATFEEAAVSGKESD
ncbi:MAG: nicotinate-nucleotide--dimethylbenzimidazole phosphoribosyltransferase [Thiohalophilus sp.]|uniref:nicotinate-nucleotide--dimethylbenzimidazole phosphoribosyltransferase n=1 Tax=Thiohalophilus sp. TaxID=3028392 RepID=UPI0028703892|nr:nicotinate-nucleotide--dimethylbenzimidazole phosphoribosyltransferase [Thiohalophilus sp.]MDR9437344.1 nicotinate-nucleotide--dimethylbenzimidazole phosphoribosyltransferase [Thiohalophilus sp.]